MIPSPREGWEKVAESRMKGFNNPQQTVMPFPASPSSSSASLRSAPAPRLRGEKEWAQS